MAAPVGYECLRLQQANQVVLPLTLAHQCGQAFRWRKVAVPTAVPGRFRLEWSLCLPDRVVFVQHDPASQNLYYRTEARGGKGEMRTSTSEWLRDYLSLEKPTAEWYMDWCARDPIFAKHAKRFTGVRILRQDPWECLCASNNNIARISQMVHKLCDHFSEPMLTYTYAKGARLCTSLDMSEALEADDAEPPTLTYHPFPGPSRLARPDVEPHLRALGFGYRARFLAESAQMLCDKARSLHAAPGVKHEETVKAEDAEVKPDSAAHATQPAEHLSDEQVDQRVYEYLHWLRTLPYYDAREELMQLQGVGPKVADCILLMSLDQESSIPVDRHVFQFADRWYGIRNKRYEEVADRLRSLWGERAGWAHTVLFYADLRSFAGYQGEVDGEQPDKLENGDAGTLPRAHDSADGPHELRDRSDYEQVKQEPEAASTDTNTADAKAPAALRQGSISPQFAGVKRERSVPRGAKGSQATSKRRRSPRTDAAAKS